MEERTQEEIEWHFNKFINLIQKMIEEKEQPHIKHQKPARKVLYGDMSTTITHKIILHSLELCMRRDHNEICNL
jgi:hypothetical protein